MRFLANENFPRPSIHLMRGKGFEVESIAESHSGISDKEVVQIAQNDDLIILTFDSDYGEIIIRHGLIEPPSVVYFRFKGSNPLFASQRLNDMLKQDIPLVGYFTVVEEDNIRQRKY